MIWFSSDWHLNHKNITGPKVSSWKSGYRNFDTTEQMNETIISTINKYVKAEDEIYFVGDFCFGGHAKTPYWRYRINCENIYFIRGNHDENIDLYSDCFKFIKDKHYFSVNSQKFMLDHTANRVWFDSHKGSIHLYGHSHAALEDIPWGRSMDVGIDNAFRLFGEYRPFSITEIIDIMSKRQILQHH
jgi:calcineurin-like phosphoesterase family protein